MSVENLSLGQFVTALVHEATGTNKIDETILLLLVYLCDWHSCVKYNQRVVDIGWKVFRWGLADDGLETYIRTSLDEFRIDDLKQEIVCLKEPPAVLPEKVKNVIERVSLLYRDHLHSGLATFALSTFPVLSSSATALEDVDLLLKAQEYAQIKKSEKA